LTRPVAHLTNANALYLVRDAVVRARTPRSPACKRLL
jgi:hypothetical protein